MLSAIVERGLRMPSRVLLAARRARRWMYLVRAISKRENYGAAWRGLVMELDVPVAALASAIGEVKATTDTEAEEAPPQARGLPGLLSDAAASPLARNIDLRLMEARGGRTELDPEQQIHALYASKDEDTWTSFVADPSPQMEEDLEA